MGFLISSDSVGVNANIIYGPECIKSYLNHQKTKNGEPALLVANELTTMHTGCYFVAPGELPGVKEPGHKVCPLTLQHAVLSIEDDTQAPNLHPQGLQVDSHSI